MAADEGPSRRNWAGNVIFRASRRAAPASVEELQEMLAGCRSARPAGTGHSFNRIADTDGTLISTTGLPRLVRIDPAARQATVSAGLRYGDVARELVAAGWALPNLGSLPHISVAGACATATHGSGDRNGNLATSVAAVGMVTSSGEILDVRRGVDPDFAGHIVALGALGVVVTMTLDLVDGFRVSQRVYDGLTRAALLAHLDELFAAAYSVSVFTTWEEDSAQVWLKRRVDEDAEAGEAGDGPENGAGGDGDPPAELFGARPASRPLHPIRGFDPRHTTQQLGVPGPWHERLPHFRLNFTPSAGEELQSEYFVAREHAAAAVAAIFEIGAVIRPALQVSELRTVAADDLWLSPAYQRDSLALHFTWLPGEAIVRPAVAAVERQLAPFSPRPHWGKIFTLPPELVRASYPRAEDFQALAGRRDPDGVLRNPYLDSYFPPA
ncbi:FAD-binding protein [Frankia sp. CNm7]|uniref:FAD-binding protein n=1 Tax=Frankia nepalensis TaxID=1836974 RepID=A0A937RA22_9ACTN|nr:FAD-binding protein [Frankia nepalensis]MBL7499109.1 FAD-binding protein [Frankia nepalensis]MBL7513878.1 FAD-binding protein [Frankia nepalensis]MBL7523160.1 FAD-binding protein [Frankia nepalensis]MBL7625902.1 FAD-binding protein [Frankia nepalensis]